MGPDYRIKFFFSKSVNIFSCAKHVKFIMGSPIGEKPIFTKTSPSLRRNNFKPINSQILHVVAFKRRFQPFTNFYRTQFGPTGPLKTTKSVFFAVLKSRLGPNWVLHKSENG